MLPNITLFLSVSGNIVLDGYQNFLILIGELQKWKRRNFVYWGRWDLKNNLKKG
jgi:hypothetical protein